MYAHLIYVYMYVCVCVCTYGWMDGWMDGTHARMNVFMYVNIDPGKWVPVSYPP